MVHELHAVVVRNIFMYANVCVCVCAFAEWIRILPFPNKPIDFELPERDYEQLCEADFPRMRNVITASPVEETKAKPEGTLLFFNNSAVNPFCE